MTTKIPPSYNGKTNFFAFENTVDDWCDINELEAKKRGPALRNRFDGEFAIYKRTLDRELLRNAGNGVAYFKRTLRAHFLKAAQTMFLYRFTQFINYSKRTQDL